jgi:hypothetical protein
LWFSMSLTSDCWLVISIPLTLDCSIALLYKRVNL